jgi:hypothetical protein
MKDMMKSHVLAIGCLLPILVSAGEPVLPRGNMQQDFQWCLEATASEARIQRLEPFLDIDLPTADGGRARAGEYGDRSAPGSGVISPLGR